MQPPGEEGRRQPERRHAEGVARQMRLEGAVQALGAVLVGELQRMLGADLGWARAQPLARLPRVARFRLPRRRVGRRVGARRSPVRGPLVHAVLAWSLVVAAPSTDRVAPVMNPASSNAGRVTRRPISRDPATPSRSARDAAADRPTTTARGGTARFSADGLPRDWRRNMEAGRFAYSALCLRIRRRAFFLQKAGLTEADEPGVRLAVAQRGHGTAGMPDQRRAARRSSTRRRVSPPPRARAGSRRGTRPPPARG
mgnify:FL=1